MTKFFNFVEGLRNIVIQYKDSMHKKYQVEFYKIKNNRVLFIE